MRIMSENHTSPTMTREAMPYRKCAGVAVFNAQGQIFVGRRKGMANDPEAAAGQLPQGGIDKGEEPEHAAFRELYEETSIRTVSLLAEAPAWIHYDLPDDLLGKALKGKYRGQQQRWFAGIFEGDEAEINVLAPGDGSEKAEFDAWRWEDLENLPELAVAFKRSAYAEIVAAFRTTAEGLKTSYQSKSAT